MSKIANRYRQNFQATLRWVPGHMEIHGNEEADKAAKLAAERKSNSSPRDQLPHFLRHHTLPLSISAIKQAHSKETHSRWTRIWRKSPRFAKINRLDPNILNRSFVKLTSTFPKRLTALLIQLRTQHIPLNKHLHRLGKVNSPHCPHCPTREETVHHLLIECPQYRRERHQLSNALGREATSIPYLLSDPKAMPHLVRYINGTQVPGIVMH
jgi:hypothetical protein